MLPVPMALALRAALKLAAAGAGMFWFLRVIGTGPIPAVVGALGFMLDSQMVSWLQWTFSNAIMLMPALFAAVERLRAEATTGRTATLTAIVALQLLGGYPQGSFHAALATGAWTLVRMRGRRLDFMVRYWRRWAGCWGGGGTARAVRRLHAQALTRSLTRRLRRDSLRYPRDVQSTVMRLDERRAAINAATIAGVAAISAALMAVFVSAADPPDQVLRMQLAIGAAMFGAIALVCNVAAGRLAGYRRRP
jgi:hypothetical protein